MRKIVIILVSLFFLAAVNVSAQQKLILVSGGYLENHHSYKYDSINASGLPTENFTDSWKSWGIGSTQFMSRGRPTGFYSSTLLFFPEQLTRKSSSTGSYNFSEFRLAINNITGVGANFGTGRLGFLIGGGFHWDVAFLSKYPDTNDSNYFMMNIGFGGGGNIYFMLNERINLHVGTLWWYDPFQIRSSSNGAISNSYSWDGGWGYNVTAGIGFKLNGYPMDRRSGWRHR